MSWKSGPVRFLTVVFVCAFLAGIELGCSERRSEQYTLQGNTLLNLGKADEALAEFTRALEADPTNAGAQLGVARSLKAEGQMDAAIEAYYAAIEMQPAFETYEEAVALLIEAERYGDAVELAESFVQINPEQGEAIHAAALKQFEAAEDEIDVSDEPATESVDDWRSLWRAGRLNELLKRRGEWNDPECGGYLVMAAVFLQNRPLATEFGEALPGDDPVARYLSLLQGGDADELVAFFDEWEKSDPDWLALQRNGQGFAYAMMGARGRALGLYSEAVAGSAPGLALMNLSRLYREAGMTEHALRTLNQTVARYPYHREARDALYSLLLDTGHVHEARQAAESSYILFPDDSDTLVQLARAYRATGDLDLAVQVLENGLKAAPESNALLEAYAQAAIAAEKTSEAQAALDELGEAARPELSRLRMAVDGDWKGVADSCGSSGGNIDALMCAAAFLQLGDLEAARSSVDLQEYESVVAGKPEELVRLVTAQAFDVAGLHGRAGVELAALDEVLPGNPKIVSLLSANTLRDTETAEAVSRMEALTTKYPAMAEAWLGLADARRAAGDREGGRAAVEEALKAAPDNPGVLKRRADYLDESADRDDLEATLRTLADIDPDDAVIANNLAYVLLQGDGKEEEALALARDAAEKLPRNPYVLHTLGLASRVTGDLEAAQRSLALALQLRPGDPTLLLDYGLLLKDLGRTDEAKRQIELSVRYADSLDIAFPRRAEAEEVLAQP